MSTVSGNKAAQFLLAQQQIEAYRKLARPETTVIVTKEVAEVKDLIEDTMNVLPLKIQH